MPIEKACKQCSQTFRVRPSHDAQRFCGQTCKLAHEAQHGRPAAQVEAVAFSCKICKSTFYYKPSYLKQYRKKWGKDPMYCSTGCGGVGRRLPEESWMQNCIQCGSSMQVQRRPGGTINRLKVLCSTECRSLFRRLAYQKKNVGQEITKRVARNGYIRMIIPGRDGQPSQDVFEHRYVMSKKLGRELRADETVHHINGVRSENGPENLELFSSRHGPGQRVTDKVAFAIEILTLYPEFAREAGYVLTKAH